MNSASNSRRKFLIYYDAESGADFATGAFIVWGKSHERASKCVRLRLARWGWTRISIAPARQHLRDSHDCSA